MAGETIFDFTNRTNPELSVLIKEYVAGNPLLDIITMETDIVDHWVKYGRDEGLKGDSGRVVNSTTLTEAQDDDITPIEKQLIIRDRMFYLDDYILSTSKGDEAKQEKVDKAFQALGKSANSRIINGTKSATNFDGLSVIATNNSLTSTYATPVTSAATAQSFMDYLEDAMSGILSRATHMVVGKDAFKVLRRVATYTQQVTVNITEQTIGKAIGNIILGANVIPIVWAGKIGTDTSLNTEVIALSGSNTDFYLVDFSQKGVTFALETPPGKEIVEGTRKQYVLEQYQMLCDKSAYCVFKHTQAVS